MAAGEHSPNTYHSSTTVLDAYLRETRRGSEYKQVRAQALWDDLPPAQRDELQHASQVFAGSDLALGAEYSQSVLIFDDVNSVAMQQAAA